MAYIGSQPTVGLVTKLSDIASSFNGILTTFQLSIPPGGAGNSFTPGSAFQIIVSLGGVIQNPATDYTLSGSQITFTTAPAAGLTCFIIALGQSINVGTPGAGTVTTSSFGTLTSIPLTGATSGTTTIQAPAVAGNNTLTLPTSNGSANQFLKNGATAGSLGYSSMVEDSSGRLLVGTSISRGSYAGKLEIEGTTSAATIAVTRNSVDAAPPYLFLAKSRSASVSGNAIVSNNDTLGYFGFVGSDGTNPTIAASITGEVDGTPGANDMPGRLVFSTTADGAGSPTERMRITNAGNLQLGTTLENPSGSVGLSFRASDGFLSHGGAVFYKGRTSDGDLIAFFESGAQEGVISVSGTTVTYGGGHLARWSQLPNGEDPFNILKGTVMSNLDEMCEWGDEDNEQLNKTKVSDVEGDANVAGVFVSTSFSDDGPLDYFVAMTGDMIIRIAESVTVERGDLLMSAGDGTAKPQDDDIIRSKTIAKITSTHVTCTYEDGSYCVPCVLMAC